MEVQVSGDGIEEVVKYKYLRVMISEYRVIQEEVTHRLHEGRQIWGDGGGKAVEEDDMLRNKKNFA